VLDLMDEGQESEEVKRELDAGAGSNGADKDDK
jgi:hypothetical protein